MLTLQEKIEIVALLSNIKPVVRMERPADAMPSLQNTLVGMGLQVQIAPFHLIVERKHVLGDEFVRVVSGLPQKGDRCILYAFMEENPLLTDRLVELEIVRPGDPEIGHLLGYPACCVDAYEEIAAGQDWLRLMLERTPKGVQGYAACNRVARLFGPWLVLPDYFPCSFACKPSAVWASQIRSAIDSPELTKFIDISYEALMKPVLFEPKKFQRLCAPSQTVEYCTGLQHPRLLTWCESVEMSL